MFSSSKNWKDSHKDFKKLKRNLRDFWIIFSKRKSLMKDFLLHKDQMKILKRYLPNNLKTNPTVAKEPYLRGNQLECLLKCPNKCSNFRITSTAETPIIMDNIFDFFNTVDYFASLLNKSREIKIKQNSVHQIKTLSTKMINR